MKFSAALLSFVFLISCANGKEKTYTGSTPAAPVIRSFLGIPLSDSIDFIRWKLILGDNKYQLQCNYGIGKPNTNGFINGGKKIELSGELRKEKNYYRLQNGNKTLNIAELNIDLLHLLDANKSLLVGNGGWSYTLNNTVPTGTDQINFTAQPTPFKDSMAFEGRTPCQVPGVIAPGSECYKLKWYIVLYGHPGKNKTGTYRLLGTGWRKQGGKTGNWNIITGKNGRVTYQLNDEKGNRFLYLLKLGEHILAFTDVNGKLLVGDGDFSYTMNRTF
jgi:hypothetical protein